MTKNGYNDTSESPNRVLQFITWMIIIILVAGLIAGIDLPGF